jgi:hypothetical protein
MNQVTDTLKERGSRYGSIEENANMTQQLMDVIMSHPAYKTLPAVHKECTHMIFHKISRMICGDCMYDDNPRDIAGYATLLEAFIKERAKNESC